MKQKDIKNYVLLKEDLKDISPQNPQRFKKVMDFMEVFLSLGEMLLLLKMDGYMKNQLLQQVNSGADLKEVTFSLLHILCVNKKVF